MIQHMIDNPWAVIAFATILTLLNLAAAIRIRGDRRLKTRAAVDRRQTPRPGQDRRWQNRRHKKTAARHKKPR